TELSGSGICSISPFRNSALVSPLLRLFSSASASISSVMSRPYALPAGPTRRADSSTSMPPPDPRSSTVSPGFNSASAVGLPQPNEAFTAASGSADFCESSYKSRVIGSISVPQQVGAQQDAASPEVTRRAASPYLILTVSLTVSVLILSSHLPW